MTLYSMMRFESFFNVWYWIATAGLWVSICWRTLGVAHSRLLDASDDVEAAEEVDAVARYWARRFEAVRSGAGSVLAALAGFGLAVLAVLGFGLGVEVALAVFMLLFPLVFVQAATLPLAADIVASDLRGEDLRKRLGRVRIWKQLIAVVAVLAAALAGLVHFAATLVR